MFFPILILAIISASGLLLFTFKKINRTILNLLIALGAGSMLAVSLVHIFPESLEQTELAVYAFILGFLFIYLIEEILTPHAHDHGHGDHTHEDPHEHYDHVAIVSFIAIFIHTLLDGLAIRAGFGISETLGYTTLVGVAIHQIPVSLSLAAIFRESKFKRNMQIIFVALFALAAPIGFILSDVILSHLSPIFTGLITAFAGGSLLYVATADLLPVIHSQTNKKYLTVSVFILGTIAISSMRLLEGQHDHPEEKEDIHTEIHTHE
ncbi:ZIP family metal transporter [Candidatus Gracilibacteria bacterium]|nr:ZIP family metal transporter [Candidatus Gracilibacteria bacterium]